MDVADDHEAATPFSAPRDALALILERPKAMPVMVSNCPPDSTRLLRCANVTTGASKEKKPAAVPLSSDTKPMDCTPVPARARYTTEVAVVHAAVAHMLEPTTTEEVRSSE
jgi:hypothetical protein